jgi:hypothetical protein
MTWIIDLRWRKYAPVAFVGLTLGATAWSGARVAPVASPPAPRCHVRGSHAWLAGRASPLDSARLEAGEAVALLCYSRPRARGRSVYDSLAPFGKVWRTGANEPTVLELTASAVVAGVVLPAGRYAILTVPQPTAWTVLFHTFTTPDSTADDPAQVFRTLREVGRGTMSVEVLASPVETFTIRPTADSAGSAFVLEWGGLRARMPVQFQR